jgi:dipeptide/tripeptide permease
MAISNNNLYILLIYIYLLIWHWQGFILLAVQAHLPQLRPPPCDMMAPGQACEEARGLKASIFFAALYLVALGSGCLKPNIIAHGADQFRRGSGSDAARRLSSYFNAAYLSFCVGELVALTVLVWVQTRSGMDVGFGVSAAAMAVGLLSLVAGVAFYRNKPPQGSIFTPIAKVRVDCITGALRTTVSYCTYIRTDIPYTIFFLQRLTVRPKLKFVLTF